MRPARLAVVAIALAVPMGIAALGWAYRPVPLGSRLDSHGFELINRERGVDVYKHKDSEIIRLGAEGRFESPPEQVLAALLDYPRQTRQIDRLTTSRVLQRGDDWLVVYQRLNLPVIDDRDFTLRVSWERRGRVTVVKYRTQNSAGPPPRDGVVRVHRHSGSWQLVPADGGRATVVRYEVEIDLSGWLPRWMAKSGAGDEIPELFAAIAQVLSHRSGRGS